MGEKVMDEYNSLIKIWRLLALPGKHGGRGLRIPSPGLRPENTDVNGKQISPRVAAVEAVMRAHVDKPIGVTDFAAFAQCSAGQLTRLFQEQRGQSPAARFREFRLLRAEELLSHSCLGIAQVGEACGFKGTSQFVRAFRAAKGVSPGAFRKNRA